MGMILILMYQSAWGEIPSGLTSPSFDKLESLELFWPKGKHHLPTMGYVELRGCM